MSDHTAKPRTKREFYEQAILELNLDVRDPFTNLLANLSACKTSRVPARLRLCR